MLIIRDGSKLSILFICIYVHDFKQEYFSYCCNGLAREMKINEWCKDFKSSGMWQCTAGWVGGSQHFKQ